MDKDKKDKEIRKRKNALKKIVKNADENHKKIAEALIDEAAFMGATLMELREIINAEGAVFKHTNGNGIETLAEHPAQKSYNSMVKNHNQTIKSLIDLIDLEQNEADELEKFIMKGGK